MTAVLPEDGLMLGIETSCDDTGVAVVRPDGEVVAAAVASQVELHDRYGGVYPEMASRAHVDAILPTVRKVLTDADLRPADLTAIGVTRGPGLIGSLVVGTNSAVGLGDGWGLPVYGVNHLRGHLRSADLDERRVEYPAMVLLVSIVAAIALTLRHRIGLKVQDISRQVSARASERVRLVKMGAESRK